MESIIYQDFVILKEFLFFLERVVLIKNGRMDVKDGYYSLRQINREFFSRGKYTYLNLSCWISLQMLFQGYFDKFRKQQVFFNKR